MFNMLTIRNTQKILHLNSRCTTNFFTKRTYASDPEKIRIGCASGFWGDTSTSANQLISKGNIDYLVFDYLSEITMSLLTAAKRKNPEMGYAPDFVHHVLAPNFPQLKEKSIKVIGNAGGVNPLACADAIRKVADQHGINPEVAVITGDDLMPHMKKIKRRVIEDMFTGDSMPSSIVSMNAYLGASPIKKALDLGAQIVVTGRCVDSAVVLAPLMHAFNWSNDDYNRLASGSLAGHLLECGAQSTGGIHTDWFKIPEWDNIGFPIAECYDNGDFLLTKPPNTGGCVNFGTVAEQLTYEIGDPKKYSLPDVVCDFSNVQIQEKEPNESVFVTGAIGKIPEPNLKICATYTEGFRTTAVFSVAGKRAIAKGRKTAKSLLKRNKRILKALGLPNFSRIHIEVVGEEYNYGKNKKSYGEEGDGARETVVWMAVEHENKKALEIFAREIAAAGTGMAPGLCGIVGGRPKASPILKLFSFLYPAADLKQEVHYQDKIVEVPHCKTAEQEEDLHQESNEELDAPNGYFNLLVEDLAYTRSGDKGNNANIGVIAREPAYYPYLKKHVTAVAVYNYFEHLFEIKWNGKIEDLPVKRYEMPGINALNFVLENCLGGGGVASLRMDPQGKSLGQNLLDFEIKNVPMILK